MIITEKYTTTYNIKRKTERKKKKIRKKDSKHPIIRHKLKREQLPARPDKKSEPFPYLLPPKNNRNDHSKITKTNVT